MRKHNSQNINDIMDSQYIIHSTHSLKRASQRGIKAKSIETVVSEGQVVYKQGIKFFYMTDKELRYQNLSDLNSLKNLVVVMAGDDNLIITCYKNKNALKSIKHKSKRLSVYKN